MNEKNITQLWICRTKIYTNVFINNYYIFLKKKPQTLFVIKACYFYTITNIY